MRKQILRQGEVRGKPWGAGLPFLRDALKGLKLVRETVEICILYGSLSLGQGQRPRNLLQDY